MGGGGLLARRAIGQGDDVRGACVRGGHLSGGLCPEGFCHGGNWPRTRPMPFTLALNSRQQFQQLSKIYVHVYRMISIINNIIPITEL